jgi:hypothetical protein
MAGLLEPLIFLPAFAAVIWAFASQRRRERTEARTTGRRQP